MIELEAEIDSLKQMTSFFTWKTTHVNMKAVLEIQYMKM